MVQGYYTLEEAAKILGVAADELNQMRERREIRAFADRGTWRFRTQDIEELARQRGLKSSPDLTLGEAPPAKPHDSPAPKKEAGGEDVFNFSLGDDSDQVEIGQEMRAAESPSSAARKAAGGKSSASKKQQGAKSPPPKPGSDSDVRLVADGSDIGFQVASESDVKLDSAPDSKASPTPKKKSGPRKDSGVRLVTDSDSDVKIVQDSTGDVDVLGSHPGATTTDSDVRLESPSGSSTRGREKKPDDSFLTEEIDLDAELRKAEEAARQKPTQPRAKEGPAGPTTSPFELSDPEMQLAQSAVAPTSKPATDSSSDFDLSLDVQENLSPLEPSSGELRAMAQEEEVSLGEAPPKSKTSSSNSGINLQEPADSGISLEQGSDSSEEIEFELSLEGESTPKPAKAEPNVDSSSEFELTLEDSARLAPLEDEAPKTTDSSGDKDIFETDFEVPALEDESGSQAVALDESDTDLESSDFDLALSDEDMVTEEESGSQVVALEDEEEVDEGAATIARPRAAADLLEEEPAGGLLAEEELEGEELVTPRRAAVAAAAPEDWGIFTPVVLCISTLILFIVGLMSLELVHGMWGFHQPTRTASVMIRTIGGLVGVDSKDLEK
jgi:excisionase family DNA binding protein